MNNLNLFFLRYQKRPARNKMEIMYNHVHLLVECDPQFCINKLIRMMKGRSSRYLRSEYPWLKSRIPSLWTNSYFVSTVGGTTLDFVKQYT